MATPRALLACGLLLAASGAWAAPSCGTKGKDIEKRVKDCDGLGVGSKRSLIHVTKEQQDNALGALNELDTGTRVWRLATRTDMGREVWLDESTGRLWGRGDADAAADPCGDDFLSAYPARFRLAAKEELALAWDDGLGSVLLEPEKALYLVDSKPPLYEAATKTSVAAAAARKAGRDFQVRCTAQGLKAKPPVKKKP